MSKSQGLGSALWNMNWFLRLLIAILFDFVFGIARLVDGIMEKNVLKIILGILWIFYGLGIGWIIDIIGCLINWRPLFL